MVVFENEDTGFAVVTLLTAEGRATAAGSLAPIRPGEKVNLHGDWTEHPKFGRQFKAEWSEHATPTTLHGMERYLGSGAFPGVGPDMAARLVGYFGADTIQALEDGEQRLQLVPGIGPKRAAALADAFREGRDQHRVLAELRGLGLNGSQARALYERWQAGSVTRIRKDPYALIEDLRGFGLETAERMARACGIPEDSVVRAKGLIAHNLRRAAREGHACLPHAKVTQSLSESGISSTHFETGMQELCEQGRLVMETDTPTAATDSWVYLSGLYEDETGLSRHIRRLLDQSPKPLATPDHVLRAIQRGKLQPDASQRNALELALTQPLCIITGGPGTGKTTILRLLLDVIQSATSLRVKLASPTGRAAKRLQEATGREAGTIHRLLGYDPRFHSFQRDAENPLEVDYLIVDEVSMMDLPLAHSLLQAVPSSCRVLWVGDADQLPSVGPGTVLKDLVHSPIVPTCRLQYIHRQGSDSMITKAAHQILGGRFPTSSPPKESDSSIAQGDFYFIERKHPESASDLIEDLVVDRIPSRYGFQDIMVCAPMYRGTAGVDEINARLSARLNPEGNGQEWCKPFRSGDRVMAVRNDYDREVFNGDVGKILSIESDHIQVLFGTKIQEYKLEQLADLVPAFCVTVHRAQGSEAQAVVIALADSHFLMLRRNLLYTAITRGRELVVVVGSKRALRRAIENVSENLRFGCLQQRLA